VQAQVKVSTPAPVVFQRKELDATPLNDFFSKLKEVSDICQRQVVELYETTNAGIILEEAKEIRQEIQGRFYAILESQIQDNRLSGEVLAMALRYPEVKTLLENREGHAKLAFPMLKVLGNAVAQNAKKRLCIKKVPTF
jgi:hypothetical protein